jgi:hypothetical protein
MSEKTIFYNQDALESPESALEQKFIAEYLLSKGYKLLDLKYLPKQQADNLMMGACRYATLKLAEIEARSKFRQKIDFPY